jgi:hypothetical protein
MTGILWAALGLLVGLGMTALGDMASEEIRDRLDHLPHAILRLAARRLTVRERSTFYEAEWLPELTYILKGAEARPITRLITGTWYALGILATAGQVTRQVRRTSNSQSLHTRIREDIFAEAIAASLVANTKMISRGIDFEYTDESGQRFVGQCKQTPPHS